MNADELLTGEVQALLDEVKRSHRYSMSRIYSLYNRVFDKDETPQSCASCLIRKVKELGAWLENIRSEKELSVKTRKTKSGKSPKKK